MAKNVTFKEAVAMVEPLIEKGLVIYQKFTCSLCSTRQGIEEPNILYKCARCELCGHITDIEKDGCGFMVYGPSEIVLNELEKKLK